MEHEETHDVQIPRDLSQNQHAEATIQINHQFRPTSIEHQNKLLMLQDYHSHKLLPTNEKQMLSTGDRSLVLRRPCLYSHI